MSFNAPLQLSQEFKILLDELEDSSKNIFITGRAGTGKSTLLRLFTKTTQHNTIVLAPTGIAALNAGGQTIHSFFRFPPRLLTPDMIYRRRNSKIYREMDTLVIDEISMVRADMMDAMDLFLRKNRGNEEPFGGVRVILFGDLFQLPPVVSSGEEQQYLQHQYSSEYFFSAPAFEHLNFDIHELHTVYRQEQRFFLDILDAIRRQQIDYEQMETLNNRVYPDQLPYEPPFITLTATNAKADAINTQNIRRLPGSEHFYAARTDGAFPKHLEPTNEQLVLKVGAQVMTLKNDSEGRYVNGSIGTIQACHIDAIDVLFDDCKDVITLKRDRWEMIKYKWKPKTGEIKAETVGSFNQIPIKLAWAITIHKSQGKTFDKVTIDLGKGAFAHGQTYVALSRCTTFEGIALRQALTPRDIKVDPRVSEFYERFVVA
jgi:ATP-dependent exoDNAse (exonuclease V) alpha subunit